jgi:SAM-dependent methyltransferase
VSLKRWLRRLLGPRKGRRKIREYLATRTGGAEARVVLGGHWTHHEGWLELTGDEQNITQPLAFPDDSLDVVFTEHVLEHIPFEAAIGFLAEVHRVLKPGGIVRTVCPGVDRVIEPIDFEKDGKPYLDYLARKTLRKEDAALKAIGISGIELDPQPFYLRSVFMLHHHRFIWSVRLLTQVLEALRFSDARGYDVGEGSRPELCIERRSRGVYYGSDWQEDRAARPFDCESICVEARKP